MINIHSKVIVYESEIHYVANSILDYPDLETGSDLFGFWTSTGIPVIQYILGPGPKAQRTATSFHQSEEYLKAMGEELRKTHGLQHLGNFHSHHKLKLSKPSQHDSATVEKAMNSYHLERFLLMIGNIKSDNSTTINAFLYNRGKEQLYDRTGFVVLPGVSPIRTAFDASSQSYLYKTLTENAKIVELRETTLEEPIASRPDYPMHYWLRSKKNRQILNGIIHRLNQQFQVLVNQEGRTGLVYLSFCTSKGKVIKVTFPTTFPMIPPKVGQFDFDFFKYKNLDERDWSAEGSLVVNTVDYIIQSVASLEVPQEVLYE